MGIDAESQDLTARITARRKMLVRAGELSPMKPGEHLLVGAGGRSGVDEASLARADMAARYRGRSRAEMSDAVVEMDYTDYTGTQPGTRELIEASDADEPFALGEDEPEVEAEENFGEDVLPARAHRRPAAAVVRPSGLSESAEILRGQEDIRERLDALSAGMLALAQGLGTELERIKHVAALADRPSADETPFVTPTVVCRNCGREDEHNYCSIPRWLRFFGVSARRSCRLHL